MQIRDRDTTEAIWREIRFRFRPFFEGSVYDWCRENVWIPVDQSATPGWFSARGREYMIECLNDWADPRVTDEVMCWGAQLGKTMVILAGMVFRVYHMPGGFMWVMDSLDQAKGVSRERWQPILRACPALASKIPTGSDRHNFQLVTQMLNNAVINMVGSNSVGKLASRPVKTAVMDEIDKFAEQSDSEASAVYLAELRTKSFPDPFRFKSSTPTTSDGPIWQEFLKGDQRRYFVPCPHCSKNFVIIWSKKYTVFSQRGDEAEIVWDQGARRRSGDWDFDRVERSARARCPHCGKDVEDRHKTKMNRDGQWIPTAPNARRGVVSRHLPSWYAPGVQTSFGALAVKFLEAKKSIDGIHGFINSECAEPWESQGEMANRIEIVTDELEPMPDDNIPILTMDFQKKSPHFWFVVRQHTKDGRQSRLLDKGSFNEESGIYDLQRKYKIKNTHVGIDSGYQGENADDTYIYDLCIRNSTIIKPGNMPPMYRGFVPLKGHHAGAQWKNTKTGGMHPYGLRPASIPNKTLLFVLNIDSSKFKDWLERMRSGDTQYKWEVNQAADSEYWDHLESEHKKSVRDPRTNRIKSVWALRSRTGENHLLDCEVYNIAMATFFRILKPDQPISSKDTNE